MVVSDCRREPVLEMFTVVARHGVFLDCDAQIGVQIEGVNRPSLGITKYALITCGRIRIRIRNTKGLSL